MDLQQVVKHYPRLYHMAEADSWSSIRTHGLLSSNEVVRRAGLTGDAADQLRRSHRHAKVPVVVPSIGTVVLRDQIPMEPARIRKALPADTTPSDWYEIINERVFFWVANERLLRLLKARQYRHLEHDVLTLDTASLLEQHAADVRLCHMNSGNTFPNPHKRDRGLFKGIEEYPVNTLGNPKKPVVELTVLRGVPDIARFVVEVRRMRGETVIRQIPL